ncbi:NAD(P)/FAD-dependent oxidoreductase [Candidatus Entotheonella palauensis]|uniref:NAD(P)/FAD-dependent oxidoreductase n=1 Tax=Candidatus Entotheonella palauensis TaxID=93172 RepID=UPI000B7DC11F|nr:NAD(P)/FAD-dependent oxidoreductase [Candidatus Entotheonella palauensis]
MTTAQARWGIVGGGILGMTLALRLAQCGGHVTLFEAADTFGGLASAWQLGDLVWDRHYHVTLLSDTALRGLLDELGLADEITWRETRTGFYTDDQLYSMSNSLEFLRFPPLRLLDKCRLAATILYASKIRDAQKLEHIPVTDWLRRWSGTRTFEKIWRPLLRAKLGDNYNKASAAFIWAIIARMYAARRSGLKKEMFGYVPGGYARILERFETVLREAGVAVKPGYAATHVERQNGAIDIAFANGEQHAFDQVVVTLAAPLAARLCPGLRADEQRKLREVLYQGIICTALLLKQPLSPFYVTNITDAWVPFTAVIDMSALVDARHLGGRGLVYLPKYVAADDPAFDMPGHELERQCHQTLARMYPNFCPDDILHVGVSRVRHVLAISTLNYSAKLPPMRTSIPGLHIVNSAHIVNGTLNVNETVQLAEQAIEQLPALGELGCEIRI